MKKTIKIYREDDDKDIVLNGYIKNITTEYLTKNKTSKEIKIMLDIHTEMRECNYEKR